MTEAESPKSVPRSPKQDTKEIKEQNTEISEEISDLNSLGFFNESRISSGSSSVKVAVRIRPLVSKELITNDNECITSISDTELTIGQNRLFTYDRVFAQTSPQIDLFDICVNNLVLGCFAGFNATVLAYGQTGSGKTFTMGTSHGVGVPNQEIGIIPRVISLIWNQIEKRKEKAEFIVRVNFLEIYNEELRDLLDPNTKKSISIREEKTGNISLYGLTEQKCNCAEDLESLLERGALYRTTNATLMNATSSRSHAIFTISIEQHIIEGLYTVENTANTGNTANETNEANPEEFMIAKFHFVDLAGSERMKKTGAVGERMKEGISINKGLLALGNVIAALTDETKRIFHVPYRDSKLTRILEDSLGGNSRTSMIACASPSDQNFEESLNTLKYAARARNIQNKPIINRDPNSAQIAQLRQNIYELKRQLSLYKETLQENGINIEEHKIDIINKSKPERRISNTRTSIAYYPLDRENENQMQELREEVSSLKRRKDELETDIKLEGSKVSKLSVDNLQLGKERDIAILKYTKLRAGGNIIQDVQGEEMEDIREELNVLEEYRAKVNILESEGMTRDRDHNSLMHKYEALLHNSEVDSNLLFEKCKELERIKRVMYKTQKENCILKKKMGGTGGLQASNTIGGHQPSNNISSQQIRSSVSLVGQSPKQSKRIVPKSRFRRGMENSTRKEAAGEKGYDEAIQNYRDLFISNLSVSINNIFGSNKPETGSSVDLGSGDIDMSMNDQMNKIRSLNPIAEELESPTKRRQTLKVPSVASPQRRASATAFPNVQVILAPTTSRSPKLYSHSEERVINNNNNNNKDDNKDDDNKDDNIKNVHENIPIKDVDAEENAFQAEIVRASLEAEKQADEEFTQLQEDINKKVEAQKMELKIVDGALLEKEKLLIAIKEQQDLMQQNLMAAMEGKYYQKILDYEKDIKNLHGERDKAIQRASKEQKATVELSYKKKITTLEENLKDSRKKDKEQVKLMNLSKQQEGKIKNLRTEIGKIKEQKLDLRKKIKFDTVKHSKWRDQRAKDLLKMKRNNLLKDKEIRGLLRQKRKQDVLFKRKEDQIRVLKNMKSVIDTNSSGIDNQVKNWIKTYTGKLVSCKQQKEILEKVQSERSEIEKEINLEENYLTKILLKKERLNVEKKMLEDDEAETFEVERNLEESSTEIIDINERLEAIQEKLHYKDIQMADLQKEGSILSNQLSIKQTINKLKSVKDINNFIKNFFEVFTEEKLISKKNVDTMEIQTNAITQLKKYIETLESEKNIQELKFQTEIARMQCEFEERQNLMFREYSDEKKYPESPVEETDSFKPQEKRTSVKAARKRTLIEPISQVDLGTEKKINAMQKQKEIAIDTNTKLMKTMNEMQREKETDIKKIDELSKKLDNVTQRFTRVKTQFTTLKNRSTTPMQLPTHHQEINEENKEYNSNSAIRAKSRNAGSMLQTSPVSHLNTYLNNSPPRVHKSPTNLTSLQEKRNKNRHDREILRGLGRWVPGNFPNKSNIMNLSQPEIDHPQRNVEEIRLISSKSENIREELPSSVIVQNKAPRLICAPMTTTATVPNLSKQTGLGGSIFNSKLTLPEAAALNAANFQIRVPGVNKKKENSLQEIGSNCNSAREGEWHPEGAKSFPLTSTNQTNQTNHMNLTSNPSSTPMSTFVTLNPNVFERLTSHASSTTNVKRSANLQINILSQYKDDDSWICKETIIDAHSARICSLVSAPDIFISTSNKSIKVWDIHTLALLKEIITPNPGFIRGLTLTHEKNIFATAYDKNISLWDINTFNSIGTLKGQGEIRSLLFGTDGNHLVSGGKGGNGIPGLNIWDLKSMSSIYEREKHTEVFSLAFHNSMLYYGSRNHQVRRIQFDTLEAKGSLEPPHFDTVTSLASLGNTVISASRDKHFRFWDPATGGSKFPPVAAHPDWVNTLNTDPQEGYLYSGGKEGGIKIWKMEADLECVAHIYGNSFGINSICKVEGNVGGISFLAGSEDRSIYLYKRKEQDWISDHSDSQIYTEGDTNEPSQS